LPNQDDQASKEFDKRVKIAELMLKEADIKNKSKIVELQMANKQENLRSVENDFLRSTVWSIEMSLLPNLDEMTDNEKMAVLESIQKSISQSKEIQKQKIAANVDLVVQALKKIESDIRSRFDDVGNAIEKRVSTIKDGRDGINGKDGRDGKDGKNGRDGAKGDRGERGQDGIDGRMVLMVFLSPMLVLILMVHLSLLCLQVLSLMLVKLLLLISLNPSKSLLMVAALLSMYLIL
jgi:hypothetical protein